MCQLRWVILVLFQRYVMLAATLCFKNVSDIIDCNLKKHYSILVIFDTSISETTGHQTTGPFSTSPNVCFCTTWEKQNTRNVR